MDCHLCRNRITDEDDGGWAKFLDDEGDLGIEWVCEECHDKCTEECSYCRVRFDSDEQHGLMEHCADCAVWFCTDDGCSADHEDTHKENQWGPAACAGWRDSDLLTPHQRGVS